MDRKETVRIYIGRIATLLLGLSVMALGIAFCIRADLGVTPISCPPYVLSLGLPFTVGQFTVAMHLLLVIGQKILLRRKFGKIQWLQIVLAFVFGSLIDGCMRLTASVVPAGYPMSLLILLTGNILLALGMLFEIHSRLILVPTDGFVKAVCSRTGHSFARVKIIFDVSLLLVSVVCSMVLLGRIEGIREGTLFSAFMVGYFLSAIRRIVGIVTSKTLVNR